MRWQGFAFVVSCALVSASTGCNSILGNDDGFAIPDLDGSDGSASSTGVPPASGPETQDESEGGAEDFDASDPTMGQDDAGVLLDAGVTVDAGGSVQDASSSVDAGPCKDHLVRCGSTCVDLTKDARHCGSRANICIPPTSCNDSKCKLN